jgi:hypothetical protein
LLNVLLQLANKKWDSKQKKKFEEKNSGFDLEIREYGHGDILC